MLRLSIRFLRIVKLNSFSYGSKDIFCSNESIESIPYFVNYRDEQISLEFNNKCVICYSTKFNLNILTMLLQRG